jgi:hypothetical protein
MNDVQKLFLLNAYYGGFVDPKKLILVKKK